MTSRYAFHHLLDPAGVLREMARVCAPGGRVVLIDVATSADPARAAEFNRMEKLRDPSHARAMPLAGLTALFTHAGLPVPTLTQYRLETDLDGVLSRSFPEPGDAERVRAIVQGALDDDRLGVPVWRDGALIRFAYPIAALVATKPAR